MIGYFIPPHLIPCAELHVRDISESGVRHASQHDEIVVVVLCGITVRVATVQGPAVSVGAGGEVATPMWEGGGDGDGGGGGDDACVEVVEVMVVRRGSGRRRRW